MSHLLEMPRSILLHGNLHGSFHCSFHGSFHVSFHGSFHGILLIIAVKNDTPACNPRRVAQKDDHFTTRKCEVAPKDGTPSRNPGDPSEKKSPTPDIWRGPGHHPRYCSRSGAGPEEPPNGPIEHDAFAIRGRTFPIVLIIPPENGGNPR